MGTVTSLFSNINKYYDFEDPFSTNYVDKTISPSKMTTWMNTLENYRRGIYNDADPNTKSDDNPNFSLRSLNLYTFGGGGKPVCAKDRWVFDSINCTNTTVEETYIATTFANGESLVTNKSAFCLSMNEKFASYYTNFWS